MEKFKEKIKGAGEWIDSLPSIVWTAVIMGLIIGIVWLCPAIIKLVTLGLLLAFGLGLIHVLVIGFRGK